MCVQLQQQLSTVSLGQGPGNMRHRPKGVDEGGKTALDNQKGLPGRGGAELDIEQQEGKREGGILLKK